jgi:hypothetical protein
VPAGPYRGKKERENTGCQPNFQTRDIRLSNRVYWEEVIKIYKRFCKEENESVEGRDISLSAMRY